MNLTRTSTVASIFLIASCILPVQAEESAAKASAIEGVWLTPKGRSKIQIYPCEQAYCGKIVWLKEPKYPKDDKKDMAGQTKVDRENPDVTRRKIPLLGLENVKGLKADGPMSWSGGTVYDPEKGKTYKAKATIQDGKLHFRGFIGFSFIGRTSVWTRSSL